MSATVGRARTGDDAGMSLPEVIVYAAVSALLLSVLAGVFYVGSQTQAAVGGRDAATGAGQVVTNSLQTSVRNASSLLVTGTLVKARVATGALGWQCVTWALTADNKLVYRAASAAITSTDYSTWTVLATGARGLLGGGAAFSGGSTQVSYSLSFASGSVSVPVAGAAMANAYGTGSPESCW
ncbi:MAG TPA: hypothetical protein VGK18_13120 [Propionicimonas sp.]|uniref:hypothetical protein n=1 Tax=Propionicimonas sp. TaxID=1955623 RepID=UPI002F422174